MTQKAQICKALLNGEVLSILTGFRRFLVTNLPREVGRQVEQPFSVKLDKKQINIKSDDGKCTGYYFEYRLLQTDLNKPGIEKMEAYVRSVDQSEFKSIVKRGPKTIHVKEYTQSPYKGNCEEYKPSFQQTCLFDIAPPVETTLDSPIH